MTLIAPSQDELADFLEPGPQTEVFNLSRVEVDLGLYRGSELLGRAMGKNQTIKISRGLTRENK